MIESYKEKVEYDGKLKEEWANISVAYEESVNDQYAARILGADWEALIIDGRLTALNDFK